MCWFLRFPPSGKNPSSDEGRLEDSCTEEAQGSSQDEGTVILTRQVPDRTCQKNHMIDLQVQKKVKVKVLGLNFYFS